MLNWQFWLWTADEWFVWLGGLLTALFALFVVGCQNPQDPINKAQENFKDAVGAIFAKVGEDNVITSGQLTGDMGIKEPGYRVSGKGGMFTGIVFDGEVRLIGVEGKMAGGLSLGGRPEPLPGSVITPATAPTHGTVAPPDAGTVLHLPRPGEGGRPVTFSPSDGSAEPVPPEVPPQTPSSTRKVHDFRKVTIQPGRRI
jgi:hypothetical protein